MDCENCRHLTFADNGLRRSALVRSGTSRKGLYRDRLHPRDGCTSRLVFHLQLPTGARRPQARHNQQRSRPHQREDPAQHQQRQEGSSNTLQSDLRCWGLRSLGLTSTPLAGFLELTSMAEGDHATARCSGPVQSSIF